ncbi:MAG TPA: FAD:protein FMN transferase [Flavobacterium sp.]|uniref:FAD:protein FMN transferase n=1 Tax=unclassified Flavobacterium TaxID=196869 RepID=UPI000E8E8CB9|nr:MULTISPECIES: FAD:protein FMN transferase [unclassified Flavobacterium]HBI01957.1 FAD:protein FMN transferase [Flavobacterium sp.]HRE78624.1 FAD:protein FMN transferase [Flavobacterium sp.]
MELKKLVSVFVFAFLMISCQENQKEKIFVIQGEAQGSTYAIKYINSTEVIKKSSIDSLLLAFDMSLSTYRPDSQISKINAGDSTIVVDDFFVETFKTSQKIYQKTNGLFDPTIGVLVNAYGFGPTKEKIDLNPFKVDSLLQFVGFDKVKLNENKTISKKFNQTYFDFNAIAQGYSVDVVADFLKSKGILNGIVEIGGEIFAFGKNTIENKNWVIGIDDPTQKPEERTLIAKIKLENLGMATSGNYRKVVTDSLSGQKFVHIINPKNGLSQKGSILSATVLASRSIEADGYATAFMIMEMENIKKLLQSRQDLYVLLIYSDEENQIQQFKTTNFQSLILE